MRGDQSSIFWAQVAWLKNLAIWNNREHESPSRVSEAFEEMLKAVQGGALRSKPEQVPTGTWRRYPEGHIFHGTDIDEVCDADAYSWDPNDFVEE
jgi:hypothetical protein